MTDQNNSIYKIKGIPPINLNFRKDHLQPKFEIYDPKGTGFVEPIDAIAILMQEFDGLPYQNVQSMVYRYDKDKNNQVDFGEFILFYSCVKAK